MSAKTPKPKPDEKSPEYERFEDFARKIIAVPKREIDEQRDKANGKKQKP
jgi:hypothetical protein